MLHDKFPRSLESLKIDVKDIINPTGYSEPEIKLDLEAIEKKAIRIQKFVQVYVQTKDGVLSETRKL